MDINNPQHWEQLLIQIIDPSSGSILKASEEVMGLCRENPQAVLMLFTCLQNSANPTIRQLAGVLCRKSILVHWGTFTEQTKEEIKGSLLRILTEQNLPQVVKKAAVDICVKVASVTLPENKWPEFTPLVLQMASSPDSVNRELALYVFQNLLETDSLRNLVILPNIQNTQKIILTLLQDSSVGVRVRALNCANAFIECYEDSQNDISPDLLLELLIPVVQAIKYCIDNADDRINSGYEFIEFMIEHFTDAISSVIPDILSFMLGIGAATDLDISIRHKALLIIEYVISYKSKTFFKSNLVQRTIDISFVLMCEPDDEEFDEETGSKYGSQLLCSMGLNIPPKYIWEPITQKAWSLMHSSNHYERKAGITAFSVLSDGCCDQIDAEFDRIMPAIINSFQDPENIVRQASCIAVAEFAKNIPGSIVEYAEQLVPILIQGLTDNHDLVRIKSCYAISSCGSSMSEQFVPHIELMLQRLVPLLEDRNSEVQSLAVSALSSLVEMAEERFEPYFGPVINVMKQWMRVTDEERLTVKARAIECVGSLASVISTELFLPHLDEVVQLALGSLSIDDGELREFVYGFFQHLVTVFPEHTAKYVEHVVPHLLATIESDDNMAIFGANEQEFALKEDDDDIDLDFKEISTRMNEKSVAISCIGSIAVTHSALFAKYLEHTTELLIGLAGFELAPPVSASAIITLVELCESVQKLVDPGFEWTKGQLSKLNSQVETIVTATLNTIVENFNLTDETVVRASLEALGKLGLGFGPVVYQASLSQLESFIGALLQRNAPCQSIRETFEEGDEDDFTMFATVMELLSEISRTLGDLFVPSLQNIFRYFDRYVQEDSAEDYTNCCVATIAEIIQELKGSFKPFCEAFLPLTIRLIENAKEDHVKHNACYCSGLLIENGGDSVFKFFPHLCNALSPLFSLNPKKYRTTTDNACGCIGRMILTNPSLVPLEQVLPVLLNALPLKHDFEPAIPVYSSIFELLKSNHPAILAQIPTLVSLFAREIVHGSELGDPLKEQMKGFLQQIAGSNNELVSQIFQSLVQTDQLTHEQLNNLNQFLSS